MTAHVFVEPYLRLAEAAAKLGVTPAEVWLQFRGRPGIIVIRVRARRKRRRIVLIPESVFNERVWTLAGLARDFRIPRSVVLAMFRGRPGVVALNGNDIRIPESVRQKVFLEYTILWEGDRG